MPTNFDLTWLNKNPAELLSFLSSLIPSLESGFKFPVKTITYSFYTSAVAPPEPEYKHLPEGQSPISTPFTETEKTTTRSLLEYLSNVVNLDFQEVNAGEGMLRFDHVNMTVGGYTDFPGQKKGWNVVFVSDANVESYYALHTLYHEIGHALGLKHPRDYFADPEPSPSLPEALDTCALSLLSYDATATNTSYAALDYAALLYIYGPSEKTNGIEYRFMNSGTALTFHIKNFGQKFSDNSFGTPFSPDSVFWVFGTKGWDSVNLSKFATSGSIVDAQNGKIAVSTDPITAIYALDYMHNQWTVPDVTGFANIHLYPADNINSFPVEALVLGNGTNAITLGSSFKTITGGAGSDNFSGFASISIDGGDGFDTWALVGNRAA